MRKREALNFDELQKAQEDTERDAFEYFLDSRSGEVIILSQDIIRLTWEMLAPDYDDTEEFEDVEPDEIPDIPEWMEDEVELALEVFVNDGDRYLRIPERDPSRTYAAMAAFAATVQDEELKVELMQALDGPGSFRRFKDCLGPHAKEKKLWHAYNAKAARKEIEEWLAQAVKAEEEADGRDGEDRSGT